MIDAPTHPLGKIRLKLVSPATDGGTWVKRFGPLDVSIPAIRLAFESSTPSGPTRIVGIVTPAGQKEKPRWRVTFFQTTVWIGRRPCLCGIHPAQRSELQDVLLNPFAAGERLVAG